MLLLGGKPGPPLMNTVALLLGSGGTELSEEHRKVVG